MNRRFFLAAVPALLATGCGFQLRPSADIPFASLYVDAPSGSLVAQRIRNSLTTNRKTRLAVNAKEAEAVLKISQEERTKVILSLSGAGLVTEYRLGLRLTYAVTGKEGRSLAALEVIEGMDAGLADDGRALGLRGEIGRGEHQPGVLGEGGGEPLAGDVVAVA